MLECMRWFYLSASSCKASEYFGVLWSVMMRWLYLSASSCKASEYFVVLLSVM